MASIKSIAQCMGIDTSGDFSVLGEFFGFRQRRVPTDPDSSVTASVSLLDQVKAMQGKHYHFNCIRVGFDLFTSASFSTAIDEIDYAVYKTRNIYAARSVGVGRVDHYFVDSADANGLHVITSSGDATDLTQDWTVPNDGMDVFFVFSIASSAGFIGISNINGPCNKDAKGRNGLISDVLRGKDETARNVAHELGHYLKLSHRNDDAGNIMAQDSSASSIRDSVELTSDQGSKVKTHCSIQSGC